MKHKANFPFFILLSLAAALFLTLLLYRGESAVMNPKGMIAWKQRNLIVISTILMLIVVIPAFILTFVFAWRYRANNTKAKYAPNWDYSNLIESIWWGLPFAIIFVLSIITWKRSHELDPFKPIDSSRKPIEIQVVALQWKWLFIYPEQNIASVNFVQFPKETPIRFHITADAPMNSFWIPELGGQIYAMPGMSAQLHLIADAIGDFRGSSANLSGRGFSGMTFVAKATSQEEFEGWVQTVKQSSQVLNTNLYNSLVHPSERNPVTHYSLGEEKLYEQIMMKYMMPPMQRISDHASN